LPVADSAPPLSGGRAWRNTGVPTSANELPWWSLPAIPAWAIVSAAVLAALAVGRFLADGHLKYGVALVLGGVYGPIVFLDLPLAAAMWTAVLYVKDLHALSVGPNTMGVLIGLAFIGAFIARLRTLAVLRQQRQLILATIIFLVWVTVAMAWAPDTSRAANAAAFWGLAALAMLVMMSTLTTARDIGLVTAAFVIGATAAAAIGLATGGLGNNTAVYATRTVTATAVNGRLTGGGGDPNLQAAGFVAAMFLSMGLFGLYRRRAARVALLLAFALISIAFIATESRGGLIALAVAAIGALMISPGQRRRLLGLMALVIVMAGVAVAINPSSLSRITNLGGGTSGRSDIWPVAARVFEQHPLFGVGTNNFQVVEPRFALLHRSVSRVTYIAEDPDPAHNTYLQLLAENGIVGLLLYLGVVVLSLRAALTAAKEFDALGERSQANLARAIAMGTIGFLAANFFITAGDDWRLWILFGLGPALLALARAEKARGAAALSLEPDELAGEDPLAALAPAAPPARPALMPSSRSRLRPG
jgi:O-antigen ligase